MSTAVRMKSNVYDSDSDSDFKNSLDEGERKEEEKEPQYDEDCPWRSAVDPNSGKTYYYHIETRETQWLKPPEMASREEKEALAAKERRQKDFFAAMEANILQSIAQGFKVPEKKNQLDIEFDNQQISDDPLAISNRSRSTTRGVSRPGLSPQRSRLARTPSTSSKRSMSRDRSRPNLVRTISSMDSAFLSALIQRVPSTRQVVRPGGSRQASNRSMRSIGIGGSSHHSNRQGARPVFPRNPPRHMAPVKKKSSNNMADFKNNFRNDLMADGVDDDELPPLTVVTTPDLRANNTKREESLRLDALVASDPRDDLIRRDSINLDQLSFHGAGGNPLMDSRMLALNQSDGSRLTMSNNSFTLESDQSNHSGGDNNNKGSGGYLSHLQGAGGSFNNKSSTPALLNNCSFNSFDSDGSLNFNNSQNGLSVGSNPLLPVQEVMDESQLSKSRILEGDNEDDETPEGEASFSLGGDLPDDNETTANWLDALPPEGGEDAEELVGYGNNAKPFSDAGFTSFFDESMANFDLSPHETKALQKLAFISEQMAKVTEGEESESDESDDEDSDEFDEDEEDESSPTCSEGHQEFSLNFEGQGSIVLSEENVLGAFPPTFRTPTTSSTTKTIGTTSSTQSSRTHPQRAPAKRTLGPKNTRVSRASRNLVIQDDDDGSDEEDSSPAVKANNLPVRNLALASATLTSDNARSHSRSQFNDTNAKSNASLFNDAKSNATGGPGSFRKNRRHSVGGAAYCEDWTLEKSEDGRPGLEKESGGSQSSINSQNSIRMANAGRRLSMFKLKNIDRSKLRATHAGPGGKGGLKEALVSTDSDHSKDPVKAPEIKRSGTAPASIGARPNLVRRNTCGTLYVGTTMSAPDKDATIKCVCGVFRAHILQSEMEEDKTVHQKFRIFNDLESQQGAMRRSDKNRRSAAPPPVPSLEQITQFYRDVFQRAQMEYDCIIISLIYVERLIKTTKGALRPQACNWRSILFSCMVLASKVWDDLSMWNADFSQTCPNGVKFPLKRINELEVAILSALSYKVKVPASEYAKYYFLLRSMLIKSGLVGDNVDTTTPLDVEGAKRLQQVSRQYQQGMGETRRQMRKAKSMRSGEHEKLSSTLRASKNKKVSLEHVVKM